MNGQKIEIGTVFGTYTVIGTKVDHKNKTNYILRCTCGNECKKVGYYVCLNRKCTKCNVRNSIGTKNHKCTFLKHIRSNHFECVCDCGNEFIGRLRSKSCGCHHRDDYIADAKKLEGYKSKYIKVLKFLFFKDKKSGLKHAVYSARCGCRKVFQISRSLIETTKSCGCRKYANQAKGETQGSSLYSEKQIKSVIDLYLSDQYSMEEISSMTRVSLDVIKDVITNRSWRHIEVDEDLLEKSPFKNSFRIVKRRRHKIQPNDQYNNWTVICKAPRKHKQCYWLCRCKCGHESPVTGPSLVNGRSKQCERCHREYFVKRLYVKSSPSLYLCLANRESPSSG